MLQPQIEIQLISVIVAVACSIPGVFLVLKRMSMMSDAITHTILLGIVLTFFMVHELDSPFLIIGAAIVGVLTFFLVELLNRTKLLSEDSSIGIVFPLLFSIAIIIISKYADDVHLDVDSVLLGEIAFAPFYRLNLFGIDFGAKGIYTMGIILILNIIFVIVFFKELKLVTFDKSLAAVLGFSPTLINYGLMFLVSVTAVGAFDSVGSILVIAFMIGPPVSAYLLTDNLKFMIILSGIIGGINGISGYQIASIIDVSIAGSIAVMTGISFLLIFIFAGKRGLITILRRRNFQKIDFAKKSMLFHIYNHECKDEEKCENRANTIYQHLHWKKDFLKKIVKMLESKNYILEENGIYKLTEIGREYTIKSYEEIVSSF